MHGQAARIRVQVSRGIHRRKPRRTRTVRATFTKNYWSKLELLVKIALRALVRRSPLFSVCGALLCDMCNAHGDCVHNAATKNVTCMCTDGWTGEFCQVTRCKCLIAREEGSVGNGSNLQTDGAS